MPPTKKYGKEDIISAALTIVEKEGLAGLSARKIARELKVSVQPIFSCFSSMTELEKEVTERIFACYRETMERCPEKELPYLSKGLSYIQFAQEHPEFFRILFMTESGLSVERFIEQDDEFTQVIESAQQQFHFSFEEQKKFHIKVWIFTHGIACLAATKTIRLTQEEIYDLLKHTVWEMAVGYQKEIGGENEERH